MELREARGAPGAQYTTVMVGTPASDYIVWSICNLIYFNPCCIGLIAFIYSIKARDRRVAGDLEGARAHGSMACCCNSIALTLLILIIIGIIVVAVLYLPMIKAWVSYVQSKIERLSS